MKNERVPQPNDIACGRWKVILQHPMITFYQKNIDTRFSYLQEEYSNKDREKEQMMATITFLLNKIEREKLLCARYNMTINQLFIRR